MDFFNQPTKASLIYFVLDDNSILRWCDAAQVVIEEEEEAEGCPRVEVEF